MEKNRFSEFNPEEWTVLHTLLQNHANTVSEISLNRDEVKIGAYLAVIEKLEDEMEEAYKNK